ncbi:MAG TPA: hypothetical protein VKR06_04340, partial [Ktedonosporobacter sp.]|nr:hypothetical protein [Ktedonosporobacter sp.]
METVVPGALQRLRAADIVRMAGLTVASQGQEYCRSGVVHNTQRQGACLSGIVEFPHLSSVVPDTENVTTHMRRFPVEVTLQSSTSWVRSCSCDSPASLLCVHAAAILYQWLAHPEVFMLSHTPPLLPQAASVASSPGSVPVQRGQDEGVKVALP